MSRDISDNIRPAIWYEVNAKHTDDGKSFIEVLFNGSNAPYSAYGRYYQRFSDEDRLISDAELERLFQIRRKDYSEWEDAPSDEHVSDIDEELLKKVISDGNESGRALFSKKGPVLLKTAIYAGTTKDTFIKLNHFEGNIYECIDEGISFVMSAVDWKVTISGSAKRKEEPEIPQTAIREMIVNAFAHGCYFSNTTFSIEVFNDKVVIYSPGSFPIGFTPEDFAYNAAEPIMLNPKIVNILFKSSVIESFGSGFERTFKACSEAGVEYEYENTMTGFRFVFLRRQGHKNVLDMSKTEKAVYDMLKENNYLIIKDIASTLSKSEKTVSRAIKGLKEKGYIVRQGTDNSGFWKILK